MTLFRYQLTDGEKEQLVKIYQAGYSIMAINRAYGFSLRSRAVENALHRMGVEVLVGKRKIPLSKEGEIVELYKSGLSIYKLSEIYGIWPGPIASLLERNGCARSNRILNDEQESQLVQEYLAGKSVQALNEQFGTTNAHKTLRRHKVKTRPAGHNRLYHINENAFDNLDNEKAAYLLGFIYAEGSVSVKKETLGIALSIVDLYILEELKSFLEYEAPIQIYKAKTPTGKIKEYCRLSVHSQVIIRKFLNLGIVRKRGWFYELLLDKLPSNVYRHFIRGIVDGDGCLDRSKRNNARLRIYEQGDILTWISDVFNQELGLPIKEPKQRTGIMCLEYGGGAQARKAITWLYQDAQIFLERKIGRMEWWK